MPRHICILFEVGEEEALDAVRLGTRFVQALMSCNIEATQALEIESEKKLPALVNCIEGCLKPIAATRALTTRARQSAAGARPLWQTQGVY